MSVPSNVKDQEFRVADTPISVHELTLHRADATMTSPAKHARGADVDIHVVAEGYHRVRESVTLLTHLHLVDRRFADEPLTRTRDGALTNSQVHEAVGVEAMSLNVACRLAESQ
ncbi:hypothetical protein [Streptomyces malaysiensis]|uniref:hypothetical protein n=1 Tax=Streptomyces malaysiensis TaxID=92644 RepID=UPI00371C708E